LVQTTLKEVDYFLRIYKLLSMTTKTRLCTADFTVLGLR